MSLLAHSHLDSFVSYVLANTRFTSLPNAIPKAKPLCMMHLQKQIIVSLTRVFMNDDITPSHKISFISTFNSSRELYPSMAVLVDLSNLSSSFANA